LLHGALLGAFSDAAAFERMLSFQLDARMDHIVPANATLSSAVFEVIQWAEGRGQLEELMKAAVAEVPGNTALQAAVRKLLEQPEPAAGAYAPSPQAAAEPQVSPAAWPRRRAVQWGLGLATVAAALVAAWILSPVTINGYILYKNSDKTVKGAAVSVPATGTTSTTDDFGFFTLQGPRATRHLYVHVDGNQYEVVLGERVGHRYAIVQPVAAPTRQLSAEQVAAVEKLVSAQPGRFRVEDGAVSRDKLWPVGATLRIAFLDGTAELKSLVKSAAMAWTNHANIHFDFDATKENADVRVSFKDEMSFAYVGTDSLAVPRDEPTIVLGTIAQDAPAERPSTILHEFGHVLGLVHEYATPAGEERIDFSVVYAKAEKEMGWNRETVDHNFRSDPNTSEAYLDKPFDPDSVMMARLPSDWFSPPLQIGARNGLSAGDRAFIGKLYPPQ
jgi:hypothetical protein